MTEDLIQIKKLIPNEYSKLKNFFELIRWSRFFLNFYKCKQNAQKYTENFYNHWNEELLKDLNAKKNWRQETSDELIENTPYYQWFKPEILEKIFLYLSNKRRSILEIGSYDGFFSRYYKKFENITLSDINENSKIQGCNFIKLNGIDLQNISNNYCDVIFSTDTFVRLNKRILEIYFYDFKRILNKQGFLICHIPNMLNANSYKKNFTMVSKYFFFNILKKDFFILEDNNLNYHSTFLICQKKY